MVPGSTRCPRPSYGAGCSEVLGETRRTAHIASDEDPPPAGEQHRGGQDGGGQGAHELGARGRDSVGHGSHGPGIGGWWIEGRELTELEVGPPWWAMVPGEMAGLVAAWGEACRTVDRLRAALVGAGVADSEVPDLAAGLDGFGRPVVLIGAVSATTAGTVADLLGEPRRAA